MWIPREIVIKRLGTIENQTYIFSQGVPRLIQGVNLDDEGQESNGAGKSMPGEAIVIALVGDVFRPEIRIADLIQDGAKDFEVLFSLYNTFYKQKLTIWRRFNDKTQQIKLFIKSTPNSEEDIYLAENEEVKSGVDEYNKKIIELIGISKEDLLNYFLIHKDKFTSFFSNGDGKKKEIIARFSGSHLLKGVDKLIESDVKVIEISIQNINKEISKLEGKIEGYKEQIEENKDPEGKKQKEIQLIEEEIEVKKQNINKRRDTISNSENFTIDKELEIKELEKSISIKLGEINTLNLKIKPLKLLSFLTEYENLDKEEAPLKLIKFDSDFKIIDEEEKDNLEIEKNISEVKKTTNKDIDDLKIKVSTIEAQIKGAITCPNCSHSWSLQDATFNYKQAQSDLITLKEIHLPDFENDLLEIENDLKDIKEELKKIESQREVVRKKVKANQELINEIDKRRDLVREKEKANKKAIDELQKEIDACNEKNRKTGISIKEKEGEIEGYKEDIKRANKQIEGFEEDIKNLNTSIIEIQNREVKDIKREIDLKISNTQDDILKLKSDIVEREGEIFEINQWNTNFIRFQTYLSNQTIKSIEGYTNYYLEKLKSNLGVLIEGYKTLADGKTVREEIDVAIIRDGSVQGKFGRFSSGEKMRVVLCNILALQRLINLNAKGGGLDLLYLDEVVESVDAQGVESLIKALEGINQTIDIITHTNHNVSILSKVIATKKNKITTFKFE